MEGWRGAEFNDVCGRLYLQWVGTVECTFAISYNLYPTLYWVIRNQNYWLSSKNCSWFHRNMSIKLQEYGKGLLLFVYLTRKRIFCIVFSVFCQWQSFLGHCKKNFGLFCTTYKKIDTFHAFSYLKLKNFRSASRRIYLFTYYLNLAFLMFKIAEILSSTYKIEHFSRFLGQNTHF